MSEPLRPDICLKLGKPLPKPEPVATPRVWRTGEPPEPNPYEDHPSPTRLIARICYAVCEVWQIPTGSMPSPRRSRVWSWPRQCAMDLCRHLLLNISYPQIGRAFGNRDHTTVMHAIKVCAERLKSDDPEDIAFAAKYREAEAKARLLIRSAIP